MGDLLPVFALLAFSSVELIVGPTKGRAFFQPFMVGNKHRLSVILRIDVRLVVVHRSVVHMHDVLAACGALCTSVHYAIGYGVVAPSRRIFFSPISVWEARGRAARARLCRE